MSGPSEDRAADARPAGPGRGDPPSGGPGWRRWAPPLLAIPFLALLAFGLTRDAREIVSPLPGQPAPDFALESLAGDSLRLASLEGRAVVLNFWASWCIPCRQEHPVLERATRTWEPEDAVVVGVLYQDAAENGRRFMRRWGGEWPSALDPASRTAIEYGVYGVPETFFIGRDGRVARKHIGPVSWEVLRATVDSLVAAEPRPPAPGTLESASPAPGREASPGEGP